EQGTTNGTTTGVDGSYSLTVKGEKGVLTFSSLGYTSQNIPVGGKATVDVKLDEDAINMSEVVVTGYGRTVTKDKLTAAISKV
ncbi:carboxypeptidase-like regulatory domain-containing protein, partial [Alistipes finegoldii]|uniref:carboxypeptidase-like regulatory domain-containing protein n=2 Tax=Alistipes TaxID=239759 RepID=UPI00242F647F